LAYFEPVIEELLHSPVPDNYTEYLRHKMQPFTGKKSTERKSHPASVQKNTNADDRCQANDWTGPDFSPVPDDNPSFDDSFDASDVV
jgi:hypothetical protein